MFVFPSLPGPPYTLTDTEGRVPVGYALRSPASRVRRTVYGPAPLPDAPTTLHVMLVSATFTPWSLPGMTLLAPEQEDQALYLTDHDRAFGRYAPLLAAALDLAQRACLATWDADHWREELGAFLAYFPEYAPLLSSPIFCVRSALEERGIDVQHLDQACAHLHLAPVGRDLLAASHTLRAVLGQLAPGQLPCVP